ncbi:hypothetical protein GGR42_002763 [Saonia flava]|uniref:Riboflavin synthase subunit beta n=1 Tax=Saonia flava TaxID=523696 RepID=A0A846R010_9FLAO|nr:hypothetical protein [Saonia flava]NJB72272.1 hypothetical protein [Saonia flava]
MEVSIFPAILSIFGFSQIPYILKGKLFKLKKNNSFKYVPRYSSEKKEDNIYSIDSRFAKYRDTSNSLDARRHWADARRAGRTKGNREINIRLLIITAILFFLVLWFFDFDLSIFYKK